VIDTVALWEALRVVPPQVERLTVCLPWWTGPVPELFKGVDWRIEVLGIILSLSAIASVCEVVGAELLRAYVRVIDGNGGLRGEYRHVGKAEIVKKVGDLLFLNDHQVSAASARKVATRLAEGLVFTTIDAYKGRAGLVEAQQSWRGWQALKEFVPDRDSESPRSSVY
jgi:hypothetical protein